MGVVPLQELDMGPIRVLLVEDELFVRIDIAATLRHAGFQVIEAACADAAMEFIESGEPIDLVFTDIQTPGTLDGLALAERVRAKYPLMPVLICSGNPESYVSSQARYGKNQWNLQRFWWWSAIFSCGSPAQYLRDCGYRVLEAVNAAEARGAVSTGRESIDIVLMDVKGVPSEGGFTLASWLRSNHPTIKVLLGGTIAKVLQLAGDLCNDAPEGGLDYRSVLDHIRRLLAGRDKRSPDRT
jgi:two-component system, response regulator PdtaR